MSNQNQNKISQLSQSEKEVLEFWDKYNIFEKSLNKESPLGDYVFYDGPPFITGLPHYATLLPSIAKDVVPRYQTMRGFRVQRVWGWDCHGLPAENKVEKELDLKNKKDIEALGVDKFVNACRDYVSNTSKSWEWYINRIGRWVDMKNAYKTMDLSFMESVIWGFKELHKKGLIYEGHRTSLHCPRCATPLSKFEITMDDGSYKEVDDKSAIVKFKLKQGQKIGDFKADNNIYILAWTTTPWTLPGNLALAVGEDIDYVLVKSNDYYILAKDRLEDVFKDKEYKVVKEFKGNDLLDLEYEPIFDLNNKIIKTNNKFYKIYAGDFVNIEDGTGIVHIAPNFGEDDFNLAKANNFPIIDLMDENGHYTSEAGEWSGLYFKKAGTRVLEILGDKKFAEQVIRHSYPFCYRCNSRLIHKTQKAWYLNIAEIKQKLLEANKKINWVPEHFKEGRFQKNIESAPDWCISRSRYWGSPVPVWRCHQGLNFERISSSDSSGLAHRALEHDSLHSSNLPQTSSQTSSPQTQGNQKDCENIQVVGSIKELEKLSGEKIDDLHRPEIDKIEFKCEKCGNIMKRVPEVLDCWMESGSMPFAQFHYPFDNKIEIKKIMPADFIIEYTGQLRGWFYYLHVLSNSLFDSAAFKNVIVTGVLAGTDGRKMSKSFGNYPDPREVLEKYGADALRYYFMSSPIMLGGDMKMSERDIQDAMRKNIMLLNNVLKFYELFSGGAKIKDCQKLDVNNILDKWILARLNQLIKIVTENMDNYNIPFAIRPIQDFIDDLSTWYIRRSRDRFKGEDEKDKQFAIQTTEFILIQLSKIMAPFMPFIAELVWQKVTLNNFQDANKSVHLEAWPKQLSISKDQLLITEDMEMVRKIVELGLSKRDEAGIKVRQPLSKLIINNYELRDDYEKLILDELNIKSVESIKGDGELKVELDTQITPKLKQEGIKRELVRFINNLRKNASLTIQDKIELYFQTENKEIKNVFKDFEDEIKKDVLAQNIENLDSDDCIIDKKVKIDDNEVWLGIVNK